MTYTAEILQSRAEDVMNSAADTALGNLNIFFDFMQSEIMLKAIFDELQRDIPDAKPLIDKMKQARGVRLPNSYKEKVQACLSILLHMVQTKEEPYQLTVFFGGPNNIDAMTGMAMNAFFLPVYKYIQERLVKADNFEFLLIRFKAKSEWFDRDRLFNAYRSGTRHGEETLDSALREYLFEQGINFPFSKPNSPSGEVDVLSLIGNKPIPLEIKIFDGDGKTQDHVRQGLRQAFCYAKDYREPSAYLVVFNVSEKDIIYNLSQKELPSRIRVGDKTIFIFTVNLFPHEDSASVRNMKTVTIEETYLLEPSKDH